MVLTIAALRFYGLRFEGCMLTVAKGGQTAAGQGFKDSPAAQPGDRMACIYIEEEDRI